MNLNTQKACTAVGLGFFLVVSSIEIIIFCILSHTLMENMGRMLVVGCTVLLFNAALWFFAIKYYETSTTLTHTKENNEQDT